MTKQTVNTEGIASAAGKLRGINSNITFVFGTLKTTAKLLDDDWKGSAGESARTFMYEIFKGNEAREAVLQSYADMLEQKINPEYIETETANKSLADKFE